jgi:hypothetical protein
MVDPFERCRHNGDPQFGPVPIRPGRDRLPMGGIKGCDGRIHSDDLRRGRNRRGRVAVAIRFPDPEVPFTQHENRGKSARILEAGSMRIGRDAHHGCWVRRARRGVGLSGRFLVGFGGCSGAPTAGETGIGGEGWGAEGMAAKTPGWRRGSSPEAAERCASLRRASRAATVSVRMNVGCWESVSSGKINPSRGMSAGVYQRCLYFKYRFCAHWLPGIATNAL